MKFVILFTLMSVSSSFAKCGANGNCYQKIGNTTYGTNARTGSSWSQTNNGSSYSGTDSSGNSYSGDKNNYQNSNGKTCSGSGSNRYCY